MHSSKFEVPWCNFFQFIFILIFACKEERKTIPLFDNAECKRLAIHFKVLLYKQVECDPN